MSTIPSTREELVDQLNAAYEKLTSELSLLKACDAELVCTDEKWRIKDLMAVRVWWTRSVVDWIEDGRKGGQPVLPCSGYKWSETPRLNEKIVADNKEKTWTKIRKELDQQFERVTETIDLLSDEELLTSGIFDWAGKWPVARWISINTTRQYVTARTMALRAIKKSKS